MTSVKPDDFAVLCQLVVPYRHFMRFLTGETNRLLKDMNRSIGNLGGGSQAAFG